MLKRGAVLPNHFWGIMAKNKPSMLRKKAAIPNLEEGSNILFLSPNVKQGFLAGPRTSKRGDPRKTSNLQRY